MHLLSAHAGATAVEVERREGGQRKRIHVIILYMYMLASFFLPSHLSFKNI